MRVLLNFSHQTRLNHFSHLEHDFYIPHSQKQWNETAEEDYLEFFSEVPDNLHFDETVEDPDVVVKGEGADVHLIQNLGGEFRRGIINAYLTETSLVVSPPKDNNWVLVGKGVDVKRFSGWEGDLSAPVMTTGNNVRGRGHVFDLEQVDSLKSKFGEDFKIYGRGKGCDEFVPNENLHSVLQKASVYVNMAKNSLAPYSLIEAMSVGLPVVSLPTPTIPDFITSGYNGIITKDVVGAVKGILNEEINYKTLAGNARKTAVGKFSAEEEIRKWDGLLRMALRF